MHTYHAFYKGKQVEVVAATAYAAQQVAALKFNTKKTYQVTVVLADAPVSTNSF